MAMVIEETASMICVTVIRTDNPYVLAGHLSEATRDAWMYVPLRSCSLRYGMIYRSQLMFSERNQSFFFCGAGTKR